MTQKRSSTPRRSLPINAKRHDPPSSSFELDQLEFWQSLEDATPVVGPVSRHIASSVPATSAPALRTTRTDPGDPDVKSPRSVVFNQSAGARSSAAVPSPIRTEVSQPVASERAQAAISPVKVTPSMSLDTTTWNSRVSRPASVAPRRQPGRDNFMLQQSIRPAIKWGMGVVIIGFSAFGLAWLNAGHNATTFPESYSITVKPLLNKKIMPGASATFTTILSAAQIERDGSGASNEYQLVGRGTVAADGTLTPSLTEKQPGLPEGEYIVALTWSRSEVKGGETIAGPDLVPQIFRSPSTSTLRVTVREGENPRITLPLVSEKQRVKRSHYDHE